MHLDTVSASAAKISRNPPLIQEKVEGYFFPEMIGPCPPPPPPKKDPPLFPTNGIAALRFYIADKSLYVYEGAESESGVYSGEVLLVDSERIEIHSLRNP